ncbi:MAG TPA: hypothetical protein VF692_08675 [Pyrinomonadaceae bacterium]
MENETQSTEQKYPLDYQEKIRRQTEVAEKAAETNEKNPTAESALEFDRALDLLLHYFNAQKGTPLARAQISAELARRIVLNGAIETLPAEN